MEEKTTRMGDGWGDNSAPNINTDDEDRRRKLTVEGREWVLQARDPYGMWYVLIPGGGAPPTALSGAYTGLWEAEAALKQYMSQHPVSPAKREAVEKGSTPPVLKTKKVKADAKGKQAVQQEPKARPSESLFKEETKEEEKVDGRDITG